MHNVFLSRHADAMTDALTAEGLHWDSDVADICDTLVIVGYPTDLVEAAIEAWA